MFCFVSPIHQLYLCIELFSISCLNWALHMVQTKWQYKCWALQCSRRPKWCPTMSNKVLMFSSEINYTSKFHNVGVGFGCPSGLTRPDSNKWENGEVILGSFKTTQKLSLLKINNFFIFYSLCEKSLLSSWKIRERIWFSYSLGDENEECIF